ncbi:MAG: heme-binding domain-containing protein [Chitinophagaceae bacterium]
MKWIKKILFALLTVFIVIQFIQPARNQSGQILSTDITKTYNVPDSVQSVLKTACYDCHSNNTNYPWYSNIQPTAWMLAHHIKEGKADLNFSEFGSYSHRRQINKLKGIEHSLNDGTMPFWSYKLIHKNANLSKEDKQLVIDWIEKTKDSLSSKN